MRNGGVGWAAVLISTALVVIAYFRDWVWWHAVLWLVVIWGAAALFYWLDR